MYGANSRMKELIKKEEDAMFFSKRPKGKGARSSSQGRFRKNSSIIELSEDEKVTL